MNDCLRVIKTWNRALKREGTSFTINLPSNRFHRRQGIYSNHHFNLQGQIISEEEWIKNKSSWLPTEDDRIYVQSLMSPVHTIGQCANWIAAPKRGINGQQFEYEYVRT
jgi:benzoyl-CoA 2,3-dioxygenase component B